MNRNDFIFSDQLKYRFVRHLIFWTLFSLHFIIQNLMVGGPGEAKTYRSFFESAAHFLYFLPIYMASSYLFTGVLLSNFFFKRRYTVFALSFIFLLIANFICVYYAGLFYLHHSTGKLFSQLDFHANKYHMLVDGIFVPITLFGIIMGIKFSKKWFLQQHENEKLAKMKIAKELQLLKTSIHPRFLFHSLRTVEKHVEESSAESPALILQLSDLLSYILYENDKDWVSFEKELEIVRGYINLEQKSFGNKLKLNIDYPENKSDTFIIPCVLLSFVETSFEYFLETNQESPSLALRIRINESVLVFQMRVSKSEETSLLQHKFNKIQKQLKTQYQNLYQLSISSDQQGILVDLVMPLFAGSVVRLRNNTSQNELPALV